jgi:hypothetical protein
VIKIEAATALAGKPQQQTSKMGLVQSQMCLHLGMLPPDVWAQETTASLLPRKRKNKI